MKKARLLMVLALALPMVAWGQTDVLRMDESIAVKCYVGSAAPWDGGLDIDAQGKNWTEVGYDDSGWSEYTSDWFVDGFGNFYFRTSFNLSEVKEDVYYYLLSGECNYGCIWINGKYLLDGRLGYWCPIPQSYLQVGENVVASYNIEPIQRVDAVLYDTRFHDLDGTAYDLPIVASDVSTLDNAIYFDAIETYPERDIDVQVKLKNANDVASYQFTINLPGRVGIQEATLIADRHDEHSNFAVSMRLVSTR